MSLVPEYLFDALRVFTILGVGLAGFYFLWKILDRQLTSWASKTSSDLDDKIVDGLKSPSKLFFGGLSILLALELGPVPLTLQSSLLVFTKLILVSSLVWAVERTITALLSSKTISSNFSEASRVLFKTLAKTLIYSLGLLVVLDTVGISITPLLASLGVGSVAVALAAQETLSNLFSGFYILIDRPFRIGDCIKIDGGIEGTVLKIGWRSTHIRLFSNSVAILPNAKVASSMVTNFDLPESDTSVTIPVGVAYDSDLRKVEQVVLEVAYLIQNNWPTASQGVSPVMNYTEFGTYAVHFNVILRAQKFTESSTLKHEFMKALHERFKQEGISMPTPRCMIGN